MTMTKEELDAIRDRVYGVSVISIEPPSIDFGFLVADRTALLAEVDRLIAEVTDCEAIMYGEGLISDKSGCEYYDPDKDPTIPKPEYLLSTEVRNTKLDSIESTIGDSPIFKWPGSIKDKETGTVIAVKELPPDWMDGATVHEYKPEDEESQ